VDDAEWKEPLGGEPATEPSYEECERTVSALFASSVDAVLEGLCCVVDVDVQPAALRQMESE